MTFDTLQVLAVILLYSFVLTSGQSQRKILLVARTTELEWIDLSQNEPESNRIQLGNVYGADYDHVDGFVYFTTGQTVNKVRLDGSEQSVIMTVQAADVVIDRDERKMYVLDISNKRLDAASLNGTDITMLSVIGQQSRNLRFHKARSELYWIDQNENKILRCKTDGTGLETLVETIVKSMGVDTFRDVLYWATETEIVQSFLGGSQNKTLVSLTGEVSITGSNESVVYWSDATTDIVRLNPDTRQNKVILPGLRDGTGMAVAQLGSDGDNLFVATGFELKKFNMTASVTQIGRIGQIEAKFVAYNPGDGLLYWFDENNKTLNRASINGTGEETLLTQVLLFGLAVSQSAGKIFWTTIAAVHKANLDGSSKEDIRTGYSPLLYASKLSVDEQNSKLYLIVGGAGSVGVYRMSFDGTSYERLVSVPVGEALALDIPRGHVYWISQTLKKIERIDVDGTNRTVLMANVAVKYMTVYGDRLLLLARAGGSLLPGLYQMDLNNVSDVRTIDTFKKAAFSMRTAPFPLEETTVPLQPTTDNPAVSARNSGQASVSTSPDLETRDPARVTTPGATGTREQPQESTVPSQDTTEAPPVSSGPVDTVDLIVGFLGTAAFIVTTSVICVLIVLIR